MMTKTTAPAGFTETTVPDGNVPDVTYSEWNGPSAGGVQSYWDEKRGVILAVDGYEHVDAICGPVGFDVAPETARAIISDLKAVLEALER